VESFKKAYITAQISNNIIITVIYQVR